MHVLRLLLYIVSLSFLLYTVTTASSAVETLETRPQVHIETAVSTRTRRTGRPLKYKSQQERAAAKRKSSRQWYDGKKGGVRFRSLRAAANRRYRTRKKEQNPEAFKARDTAFNKAFRQRQRARYPEQFGKYLTSEKERQKSKERRARRMAERKERTNPDAGREWSRVRQNAPIRKQRMKYKEEDGASAIGTKSGQDRGERGRVKIPAAMTAKEGKSTRPLPQEGLRFFVSPPGGVGQARRLHPPQHRT